MSGKIRYPVRLHGYRGFSVFLIFFVILFGCNKDSDGEDKYLKAPVCKSAFTPKNAQYKVVGFYPSWRHSSMPVSSIPWDKLTRIVYTFAVPNADGTIDTRDLTMIQELTDEAHAHGVQVYLSVGGGDGSNNFSLIASKDEYTKRFVQEVKKYIFENCLDGVDIDWEYWSGYRTNTVTPSESNILVYIVKSLKEEFSPFGLGVSIDLGASHWAGKHFFDDVAKYADDLQIMCYDFSGPWSVSGPHSSYDQALGSGSTFNSTGLAYWINYRKWPKEKILLGVPFYGRDFDNGGGEGITYADIIKLSPEAYKDDRINNIYYDGIITIARKAQYVVDNKLSGIMIWEIGQDSSVDSTSLLSAINSAINP